MTFSQGDIHNHLRGARQGDARERYVFIVAVKLSIEFGNDPLFEQLPHCLASGLSCHPAADPFAYLALFDGVVISHQLGQGVQESSKSCHIKPPEILTINRPIHH